MIKKAKKKIKSRTNLNKSITTVRDNKIAYINLTNGETRQEEISPKLRREYYGGGGINTKILYDSEAMYSDALSDKNVLIFGVGPVVGSGFVAGNRCAITAKSPMTDLYGDSNVGGNFNVWLRSVGIDHLVLEGKAKTAVYIHINAQGVISILDATDMWGMQTDNVTDILHERYPRSEIACIGTAGETLCRYATVMMSKTHAAGRMGMGAVMGSKNLKAIVVELGKCKPPIYDREKFNKIKKSWFVNCRNSMTTSFGSILGTLFLVEANDKARKLPIRNYQSCYDEQAKNIYPTPFIVDHETKKKPCYACPVGCAKAYETREGRFKGEKGERLEFGIVAGLGSCLGIFDWPSIIHLKNLANNIGVDTIEVGAAISFVLECLQRGILNKNDFDGKEVKFGDVDDIEYLMNKLVKREGIGDLIAEGPYRAAKVLHAEDYAFCIKKSSTGPQANNHLTRTLEHLTSTRGGDHLKCFPFSMQNGGYAIAKKIFHIKDAKEQLGKPDNKGRIVWWHENYKTLIDALGVCLFAVQGLPGMGVGYFKDYADLLNAMFDFDLNDKDVLIIAERIYHLQNSFNVNCGLKIDDYKLPVRKKEEDIDDRYIAATTVDVLNAPGMLPEYFEYRGLTMEALPTVKRFRELGLEEYIGRAKGVEYQDVKDLDELLKTVNITVKFNPIEKFINTIVNKSLGRNIKKKVEKGKEEYLLQKEIESKNEVNNY